MRLTASFSCGNARRIETFTASKGLEIFGVFDDWPSYAAAKRAITTLRSNPGQLGQRLFTMIDPAAQMARVTHRERIPGADGGRSYFPSRSLTKLWSLRKSAANRRIPSPSFSVAMASSFISQRKVFSLVCGISGGVPGCSGDRWRTRVP